MADEHDDLLNFEIGEGDYADGTINEDELLLSDEENFEDPKSKQVEEKEEEKIPETFHKEKTPEEQIADLEANIELDHEPEEEEEQEKENPPKVEEEKPQIEVNLPPQQHPATHRPPFRPQQKFQPRGSWNGMPRWQGPPQRPPMMVPPPGARPPINIRPFPPQRAPFFMPPGNSAIPPIRQPRFFYRNAPPAPQPPPYIPTPQIPPGSAIPRKVLINPNFKGGVEAVKSQLMKDFTAIPSTSLVASSEEDLLRKQEEFINRNMRSIEKRKYERSPSPNYRRSYSNSPSPPRYHRRQFHSNNNRGGGRGYERRRSFGDRNDKKDENNPDEDEETKAYRREIEKQKKQREELLKQKEMKRKQQMEQQKVKEQPSEPLKPIVVTEKKIILTKKPKLEERSMTPPLSQRRIVLKPKEVTEGKIGISGTEKRKLQNIIKAEN